MSRYKLHKGVATTSLWYIIDSEESTMGNPYSGMVAKVKDKDTAEKLCRALNAKQTVKPLPEEKNPFRVIDEFQNSIEQELQLMKAYCQHNHTGLDQVSPVHYCNVTITTYQQISKIASLMHLEEVEYLAECLETHTNAIVTNMNTNLYGPKYKGKRNVK